VLDYCQEEHRREQWLHHLEFPKLFIIPHSQQRMPSNYSILLVIKSNIPQQQDIQKQRQGNGSLKMLAQFSGVSW